MSARLTAAERRAFNDGLQAALLAICIERTADSPLCPTTGDDVCLGCKALPSKRQQLIARIKALKESAVD